MNISVLFSILIAVAKTSNVTDRVGKFFPFGWGVGVVRFENSVCTGGDSLDGTCYTKRQCNEIGGTASGNCASGIGVCCIVQITCGGSSSYNNTYFVSPNFPNPVTAGTTCSVTIPKCNSGICQIRIDFLSFNLAQPNAAGSCVNDAFYVVGGGSTVPVLCGENTGQHIYVDFNGDADIQLVVYTTALASFSRTWNMKITQIGCDCPTRAPTGCLQYYTALSGTVTSFNYGTTTSIDGTRQLANENYGVCVQMQAGYCSITWSQTAGDIYSFTVSGNTNSFVGDGTVGTAAAAVAGATCTGDFVVVPNPVYVDTTVPPTNTDRFCGNGFQAVTTFSKPFVLTVVTDAADTPPTDVSNRGFSLSYTQNQCARTLLGK